MSPVARRAVAWSVTALAAVAMPCAAQEVGFQEAAYDWTLRGVDGDTFRLADYRGRPLVLNVWATRCAPCVAELPGLERLATSLQGTGVEVLAVSPESLSRVLPFLDVHGLALPAAVEDQRIPAAFGLRALPTTYVLDAEGRIVLVRRGAADWDQEPVRRFLLSLIP